MTYILGISAFYHDSAACLIRNGKIVAAAQEERFTRVKHDARFPTNAIQYCINDSGVSPSAIKYVVFYEKPFLKFERLIESYLAFAPRGFRSFKEAMPLWIKQKIFQKSTIVKELQKTMGKEIVWQDRLLFSEHHLSHAASAFYPSPFDQAAILTLDGVGEWATSSLAIGNGADLKIVKEIHFPHSLGLLYSAFTYYTGFRINSGEYKMMGLAPFGVPKYSDLIKENLIDIKEDGSFHINMAYFDYCTGLTMTNRKFNDLFGGPPRKPESTLTQRDADLSASIQKVTEEVIVKLAKGIAEETNKRNLCLSGGVALNCVANGVLLRERIFDNVWIQPAAGDAGGALGAALAVWYNMPGNKRTVSHQGDAMNGSYLGPAFNDLEVKKYLKQCGAIYHEFEERELIERVAGALAAQNTIGWMQGRMEFGPRALGGRSILADPRSSSMQKQLNLKVKHRESFRPFAPSVLRENLSEWFNLDTDSPYMAIVADLKYDKRLDLKEEVLFGMDELNVQRSEIPAVTHVDFSARIQTVHSDTNPLYHALLTRFQELTGCPLVVNTSFNVRGEPIVCTPEDAFRCFMSTGLDMLVIGNYLLVKTEQTQSSFQAYGTEYELGQPRL